MGDGNCYPALLPVGFHAMDTLELRKRCVDDARFHLSSRRAPIMENLETLISGLRLIGISGKIWIDGSFLTEKIDPNDVDVLLDLQDEMFGNLRPPQKIDVDWLQQNEEIRRDYYCDCHVLISWPPEHPSYAHGEWLRAFYHKLFGWDEFYEMKGIAIVVL
jgi:hypothetical protein